MTERLTAALRRAAQRDAPPPLDDARARRMVALALVAASDSTSDPTEVGDAAELLVRIPTRRTWPWLAAVVAAAATGLVVMASIETEPATVAARRERHAKPTAVERAPSRVALPTGDRLVAGPGAEYDVVSLDADRRVRLDRGILLCDVRSRPDGGFVVDTTELRVEVLGTVFALEAERGRTTVWVYEGRVRVTWPEGDARELVAGESMASDGAAAGASSLDREGRTLARDRQRRPRATEDRPETRRVGRRRAAAGLERAARGSRPHAPAEPPAARRGGADLHAARVLIGRGAAREARERADEVLRSGVQPDWLILRADAERALSRPERAIDDLEQARVAAPDRRAEIAYRIAVVRLRSMSDPAGALQALERDAVTARGSVLAERGLALAIEAHDRLGRGDARRRAIDDYLRRFGGTSLARRLRAEVR